MNNPEVGTAQCGANGTGNNVDDDPADDGHPSPPAIDDGCPSTIYTYDALNRITSMTYIDVLYLGDKIGPLVDVAAFALTEVSLFSECNGWQFWLGSAINSGNLGVGLYGAVIITEATGGGDIVAIAAVMAAEFALTYATGEVQERCSFPPVYANSGGKE